jgi:hypothetical protein
MWTSLSPTNCANLSHFSTTKAKYSLDSNHNGNILQETDSIDSEIDRPTQEDDLGQSCCTTIRVLQIPRDPTSKNNAEDSYTEGRGSGGNTGIWTPIPYKGVSYSKQNAKYQAIVHAYVNGNIKKQLHLGFYLLQSDGARAFDRGAAEFKVTHDQARNFKTTEEYTTAREQELRNRGIEKEAVGSVYDIEKQITDRIIALQQPKQLSSAFKGVCKPTGQSKYLTQIRHNKKVHNIGYYQLESDAAYAYDEAVKLFKGPSRKLNFNTTEDHIEAREFEVKQMGVDSDEIEDFDTVRQRIKQRLKKMTKESATATPKGNEGMLCSAIFSSHVLKMLISPAFTLGTYHVSRRK